MPGKCAVSWRYARRIAFATKGEFAIERFVEGEGWTLVNWERAPQGEQDADLFIKTHRGFFGLGSKHQISSSGPPPTITIPDDPLPQGWQDELRILLHEHDPQRATPDQVEKHQTTEPASGGPTRHVFISYAREDQDYVDRLVAHLHEAAITAWLDKAIDYGDRWETAIQQAIDDCGVFVVIMSPHAASSRWVGREIGYAEDLGKPTMPLLANGKPFFRLQDLQHEDVTDGTMPSDRWIKHLTFLLG